LELHVKGFTVSRLIASRARTTSRIHGGQSVRVVVLAIRRELVMAGVMERLVDGLAVQKQATALLTRFFLLCMSLSFMVLFHGRAILDVVFLFPSHRLASVIVA
jgi:hypothetical protein